MKFAKILFWCAGGWGFLVLLPMYFLYGKVGGCSAPAPTHPQYYYGFLGVTLAWQVAFFVIAIDPARFRPMIIPSIFEKLIYVLTVAVLYLQNHISGTQVSAGAPDALLCLLFVLAFYKTRSRAAIKPGESSMVEGVR